MPATNAKVSCDSSRDAQPHGSVEVAEKEWPEGISVRSADLLSRMPVNEIVIFTKQIAAHHETFAPLVKQ